ncbi:MAG: hypothetical protein EZS28_025244 [Streblomastix strix]|uniref:Uncharacterized protein n=1 Tax=Streblomastix strix TaxID=222440 RepID=A0A5J4V9K2_9EUKA|nr:MAG: hypothetical protein EZS28_025244 [Streblomastix strix]
MESPVNDYDSLPNSNRDVKAFITIYTRKITSRKLSSLNAYELSLKADDEYQSVLEIVPDSFVLYTVLDTY